VDAHARDVVGNCGRGRVEGHDVTLNLADHQDKTERFQASRNCGQDCSGSIFTVFTANNTPAKATAPASRAPPQP
jgi:hypothetical protein